VRIISNIIGNQIGKNNTLSLSHFLSGSETGNSSKNREINYEKKIPMWKKKSLKLSLVDPASKQDVKLWGLTCFSLAQKAPQE